MDEVERKLSYRRLFIGCAIWALSPLALKPLALLIGGVLVYLGVWTDWARLPWIDGYLSGALLAWLVLSFEWRT